MWYYAENAQRKASLGEILTAILDGVTDLGITANPFFVAQAINTCAGSLFKPLAIRMTSGASITLGLPVVLFPKGE